MQVSSAVLCLLSMLPVRGGQKVVGNCNDSRGVFIAFGLSLGDPFISKYCGPNQHAMYGLDGTKECGGTLSTTLRNQRETIDSLTTNVDGL